jgi:hypothetical protein
VENVVQANLQAFEALGVAGMAFNLGTGGRYTLNKTLRLLETSAGRSANAKKRACDASGIGTAHNIRARLASVRQNGLTFGRAGWKVENPSGRPWGEAGASFNMGRFY